MEDGKRLLIIRHGFDPADDRVAVWAQLNGLSADVRRPFDGEAIGALDERVAGVVMHGGKFDADSANEHPFLRDEDRLIGDCILRGTPLLGICQGAQQIAFHLGAFAGEKPGRPHEFGYYPVMPTDEAGAFMTEPLVVAQAHFHTFDIPDGGVRLAGNDDYPNQAFRYGDAVFGLQFHPEVTIEGFRRWQDAEWAPWHKAGVQTRAEQDRLMAAHDAAQARWFYAFLDGLFGPNV